MGFEDLLVIKGLENINDLIDEIENSLLKGLTTIGLFVILLWFLLYFLGWQGFMGYWKRSLVIIGLWLFLEFAYFIGGGHVPKKRR